MEHNDGCWTVDVTTRGEIYTQASLARLVVLSSRGRVVRAEDRLVRKEDRVVRGEDRLVKAEL